MSDTTTVDPATRKPRPLSPHLQVYKPIPTMVMSILHRITGAALYVGTIFVVWWLVSIAGQPVETEVVSTKVVATEVVRDGVVTRGVERTTPVDRVPESFSTVSDMFSNPFSLIILFGYTWVLIHHMLGGLKHLMQDTGHGLDRDFTTSMAYAHIIASAVLTVLLWIVGAFIV